MDEDELARMQAMTDQLGASTCERRIAARKEYVDGPDEEPTLDPERLWVEGSIECCVVRTPGGWLCGYARVPDDHPWVGLNEDDPVPAPRPLDEDTLAEEAMDDFGVMPVFLAAFGGEERRAEFERSLGSQVNVHGGVTFAGVLSWVKGATHGWWIGFDCHHAGDAIDPAHATGAWASLPPILRDGHVWTVDEAALECKRMATAIAGAGR